MANLRRLKKEIDSKVYELISDCLTHSGLHPDDKPEEISGILSDAVSLWNDLIHRVNNPDREADPKEVKAYYQLIKKDLNSGIDSLFEKLSSVTKKKKK